MNKSKFNLTESGLSAPPRLLLACTHSFGAKFLQGQLNFMRRNGFEVVVICAAGKEIESLCEMEGATFVPFPFRRDISFIDDLKSVFRLRKLLKSINPDIINTGTPKAGLLICLAAKLNKLSPTIFTLRGLRSETLQGGKKSLVKSMESLTCRLADVVIPISNSLAQHAVQTGILPAKKQRLLGSGSSNGVDVEKFSPALSTIEKNELRRKLNIEPEDFVVGYVGRINNDKGVVELYNTFKKLAKENHALRLLIVGKFEDEDSVPLSVKKEMEADDDVTLLDYQEDVRPIYEITDVLVLFSKREGFGNILIEASSMGVPVIASNIPGCRDAVNDGVSGYLVNDVNELKDKLEFYYNNRFSARVAGERGREWVIENFKSEVIWSKQLDLYCALLKQYNGKK